MQGEEQLQNRVPYSEASELVWKEIMVDGMQWDQEIQKGQIPSSWGFHEFSSFFPPIFITVIDKWIFLDL